MSGVAISETILIIASVIFASALALAVLSQSGALSSQITTFFTGVEERAFSSLDIVYLICNRTGTSITGIMVNNGLEPIPVEILEERYRILVGPPNSEECPQCVGATVNVSDSDGDGYIARGELATATVIYPSTYASIYNTTLASMVINLYYSSSKAFCSFP